MGPAEHICIIGAKGMLGGELAGLLAQGPGRSTLAASFAEWHPRDWPKDEAPHCRFTLLDLDELDITHSQAMLDSFEELRPTLVINAAAYTDVDGCESHEPEARAVNVTGPANLAQACARLHARLIHVSTDYVFNGRSLTPYLPDDPIDPQSVYGKTKSAGEAEVRRWLPGRHLIVRTSWLFGVRGKNFVKTILKLAAERSELKVVTDQVGCPTYAHDLAAALLVMGITGTSGTVHFCNAGPCSWNEFATEIVRLSGAPCRVLPQLTADLKRPAPRPAYSVLSTESLTVATGLRPRPWQKALSECVDQLG